MTLEEFQHNFFDLSEFSDAYYKYIEIQYNNLMPISFTSSLKTKTIQAKKMRC